MSKKYKEALKFYTDYKGLSKGIDQEIIKKKRIADFRGRSPKVKK